jgi:hypothetical protein
MSHNQLELEVWFSDWVNYLIVPQKHKNLLASKVTPYCLKSKNSGWGFSRLLCKIFVTLSCFYAVVIHRD